MGQEDLSAYAHLWLCSIILFYKIQHYIYNHIRTFVISMETFTTFSTVQLNGPPIKPLEGYFRFRQEMMKILDQKDRTSENIVLLWNTLSEEEKAIRGQQQKLQLLNYQRLFNLWQASKVCGMINQIPLQQRWVQNGRQQSCGQIVIQSYEEQVVLDCKLWKRKSIRKESISKSQIQNKSNSHKRNK